MSHSSENPRTSPLLLLGAWLVVGLPLAYGVSQTFIKAAKLFAG